MPPRFLRLCVDCSACMSCVLQGAVSLKQATTGAGPASVMVAAREGPLVNHAEQESLIKPKARRQHESITIAVPVAPPLSHRKRLAIRVKEKSECIEQARQSIYRLKLKKVMDIKAKGVAKYEFGRRHHGSQEYFVMLVGATGAGKTTLINGVANYILGVHWKDDFRFKLIAEDESYSWAHSQTKCITAYTIHQQHDSPFPHTLTIVDTPGFGDTEGLHSDKRIVAQIKDFFSIPVEECIDCIHGIGLVTHACIARLTPTQRYIFDSILAIFGKDIGNNILLMTTFADGKTPPVLEAVEKARIKYHRCFKFNNSAIFSDEASVPDEDQDLSFDKMFWEMGQASFAKFFMQLMLMEPRTLSLTKEVLEEREQLEAIVESLQPRIEGIQSKIDTLKQEQRIMERHEADIKGNKNFFDEEIKKRYEDAMTGKATKEKIVSMIRSEIVDKYREVFHMIRIAKKILQRLDEIALLPNPLGEVEYIDMLIQAEQQQHRDGFMGRIEFLRTVRQQDELLSTVKDDKIFQDDAMRMAQQLAEAETNKNLLQQAQQLVDADTTEIWTISASEPGEKGFWDSAKSLLNTMPFTL